jgi:hypothetical protein
MGRLGKYTGHRRGHLPYNDGGYYLMLNLNSINKIIFTK